jgi:WD40 repeat protein/serine/threonine protein kinase
MGAILWARDNVLGREVAVKVLLDSHKDNRDAVRRFINEAQISARLQHPGIAPIHDLGRFEDQRPFLAMKLVRGKTLASILSGWTDEEREKHRSELLTIFERLCDTVAYAHSQGIIHRDLKPDNIMIGQFGEVQVMDWGLAKVLSNGDPTDGGAADRRPDIATGEVRTAAYGQTGKPSLASVDAGGSPAPSDNAAELLGSSPRSGTETRVGVIMGTPAYMPPEQTVGRSGKTTDVFSLGAILCEILTGKPPYRGDSPVDVFVKSTSSGIPVAFEALATCSADEELVVLSKECLDVNVDERLHDAVEVTRRFSSYMQATQSRLHEAKLSRVRAETATAEERKRRRVTLALASSVLALVVIGLGAWAWISSQRARLAETIVGLEVRQRESAERQTYFATMASAFHELDAERYSRVDYLLEKAAPRFRNWEWDYIQQRFNQHVGTLDTQSITAVLAGFVRDTNLILTVDVHNVARFYDRSTGKIVVETSPGPGQPWAICPDGVFVLSQADVPVLWKARTGRVVRQFDDIPFTSPSTGGGKSHVSSGGSHVAIVSNDNLLLVEVATGDLLKTIPLAHRCSATFSADGKWLVWCDGRTTHFWDLEADCEARTPVTHERLLGRGLDLSPDRSLLATTHENKIIVSDLQTGVQRELQADSFVSVVHSPLVTFSADSSKLVSIPISGPIRVWQPRSGELLAEFVYLKGSPRSFSWDGPLLLTLSAESSARLWDTRIVDMTVLRGHASFVYSVAVSPDGTMIASGSWDHTVRLWDGKTGAEITVLHGHRAPVVDLAFDPAGGRLVSASSHDRSVFVWDTETGMPVNTIEFPGSPVMSVEFSPDGSDLFVAHGGIDVLDAASFELKKKLDGALVLVAFSPTGESFATLNGTHYITFNGVTVWDATSLTEIGEYEAQQRIRSLTYSPDGSRLLLGGTTGSIIVRDPSAVDKPLMEWSGHDREIFALAYLPDGTRFFSAGRDGTIRIWDAETGEEVGMLTGHDDYVYSLAVSPDGRFLVSGSGDSTVRIWHTLPLAERSAAIRESEVLRPRAEELVERLFAKEVAADGVNGRLKEVVRRIKEDDQLTPALRREALHAVLRRSSAVRMELQATVSRSK